MAKSIMSVSKVMNGGHLLNSEGVNIGADWMMDHFGFLMDW